MTPSPELRRARRSASRRRVRRRRLAALAVTLVAAAALVAAVVASSHGHQPARHAGAATGGAAVASAHRRALVARERAAIDRDEARLPYVASGGRRRHEVALTFDDGPGPYTLRIARELHRLHAPATFFQVGFMMRFFTDAERYLVRHPAFVLGDHTRTHPRLTLLAPVAQDRQVADTAAIQQVAGAPAPRLFRPPFGAFDRATLAILRRHRMLMVLWTVDGHDYVRPGARAIAQRVLARTRPGAIVLLHDAGGDRSETLAALPAIVHRLRRRHARLVTVPRLLADDPPPLRQRAPPVGVG